jgi:hypothetical protein
MVWQGTVNPPLFGANRFDPYHLHQFWLVRIMVITSDCLSDHGSSILPRVASLLREGSGHQRGLISLCHPWFESKSRYQF